MIDVDWYSLKYYNNKIQPGCQSIVICIRICLRAVLNIAEDPREDLAEKPNEIMVAKH